MVEVIGQDPKFTTACRNCGAELRFTRDEVEPGEPLPHSPDQDYDSVISCPVCGKKISVSDNFGVFSYEGAQTIFQRRTQDEMYDI